MLCACAIRLITVTWFKNYSKPKPTYYCNTQRRIIIIYYVSLIAHLIYWFYGILTFNLYKYYY